MTSYTHAAEGNCWVLTAAGKAIGRVKAKFNPEHPTYKKAYKHTIPTAWVLNGWVEERSEQ